MFWEIQIIKKPSCFMQLFNSLEKRRKCTGMGKSQSSTNISKKMKKSDIIDKSKHKRY